MIKSVTILFAMVSVPLLVGGCEASTAAVSGPVESNSSPATSLARVPFRNVGGHVVVPVSVNGSRNLDMVLDTGMSTPIVMLMHRELQDEVGLGGGEPTLIGGAGGGQPKQGKVFSGDRVSIGDFEQPDQTVIVMDESRKDSTWTMDGVIGKSIFDRYLVEIDFEQSVLSLHEPAASDRFSMASLATGGGSERQHQHTQTTVLVIRAVLRRRDDANGFRVRVAQTAQRHSHHAHGLATQRRGPFRLRSQVNAIKRRYAVFREESPTNILPCHNPNVLLLWKASAKKRDEALLILNKDPLNHQDFYTEHFRHYVQAGAPLKDVSPEYPLEYLHEPFHYSLRPGQGIVLVTERG